jgi:hypothetical protein
MWQRLLWQAKGFEIIQTSYSVRVTVSHFYENRGTRMDGKNVRGLVEMN